MGGIEHVARSAWGCSATLRRMALASWQELLLQTGYQGVLMSAVGIVAFNRAVALLGPGRRVRSSRCCRGSRPGLGSSRWVRCRGRWSWRRWR